MIYLSLLFIIPIAQIIFINIPKLSKANIEFITICSTIFTFISAVLLANNFYAISGKEFVLLETIGNLRFSLFLDKAGLVFILLASFLWIFASLFSFGYMNSTGEKDLHKFYSFFALSIMLTFGIALSANLLTFYLFYESLSLATFPLVTHYRNDDAKAGGRKYLTYLFGSSLILSLPALVIIYLNGGNSSFALGGIESLELMPSLVVICAIFGFSKSALFPFHSWLPNAMVAPTPVSSLLHAVAVVKAGVFGIIRVVGFVFGFDYINSMSFFGISLSLILVIIASISVLYPSLVALSANNLKRRLAFSTISQLAYISIGAFLLSKVSIIAALLHIVMHALSKIILFFVAGGIYVTTGIKYISDLKGMGRKSPFLFIAFIIGSFGVVGLPISGGFYSKFLLLSSTINSNYPILIWVFLLSSVFSSIYLFQVPFIAFQKNNDFQVNKKLPFSIFISILLVCIASVLIFFFADQVYYFLMGFNEEF